MIDWEEIIRAESVEELKSAKLWLFQENMRLENEKKSIEEERRDVEKERRELEESRSRFMWESKRLKDESLFFDKKMEILQDGFRHLEEDRKKLERERKSLDQERRLLIEKGTSLGSGNVGEILFRSVNSSLGLKKRYKDLVKIFHPDNLFGDEELAQLINKEFQRRRRDE